MSYKIYQIQNPEGIEFCILGLTHFCLQNNLDISAATKVVQNKLKHYKQYKFVLLDEPRKRKETPINKLKKYHIITPIHIPEFYCYGLQHLKNIDLNPTMLERTGRTNSRNKTYKGYKVIKIQ